ncbi:MAG: GWxTD domain-containing protein [Ekhidna sp.]
MRKKGALCILLVFIIIDFASAINFTRVNIAWQYDPLAEVKVSSRAVSNGDEITIFYRIEADSVNSWFFDFLLQENYTSESHTELTAYKLDTLSSNRDEQFIKISFNKSSNSLLALRISKPEVFYYHDTSLKNGSLPLPSIYPVDKEGLPILENFINSSYYSWSGSDSFYALQYQEAFSMADLPMADMKPLAPSIDIDSSFVFYDSAGFKENHIYIVRPDSNATSSVTILRDAIYFPEFRKLSELIESMFYITNEAEKKALIGSNNLKQSFDAFWVNTYKSKFRARNAIRNYYGLVTQSNYLFTDFKQGWKTDRGMLFIVFGVPDEVYRSGNKEEWYYDNGPSFEFTIISTFFAPRTYALRRNLNLEEAWYENISALRRGINE